MHRSMTSPMSISLRLERPTDEPFLRELYGSTREDELDVTGWSDEQKTSFIAMQFDAQTRHYHTHYADMRFSIIEVDGVPAGRLYVARWSHEIRIVDIALMPGFRNRGIGTALIQEVLDEGAGQRLPVTIHVEKFNPAFRLYERLGFRPIEDKGVYWLLEWSAETQPTSS